MSRSHRPDYLVRIGGQQVSPADATPLVALKVHAGKNDGAGEAVLRLGAGLAKPVRQGDTVRIELGEGGQRTPVFAGTLVGIEPGVDVTCGSTQLTLRAHDAMSKLILGGRRSKAFENQTFGDIVKSHAADAGVGTATIEDGARVAHLYMHRQTAYEHCLALAVRAGFDLYATEEGKVTFARFRRSAGDHTVNHGVEVLRLAVNFHPLPSGVTVVPESPASSAGDDTAAWLVKDASAHAATQGDADVSVIGDSTLRTRDNAEVAAQSAFAAARRLAMHAELELQGRAEIRLGQAVEIKQMPDARVNRVYEVLAITHTLDRAAGFRTRLKMAAMGDAP
jgi:phage protein D